MELTLCYPYLDYDYKITISGPENNVYYVATKLGYMSLNELNDDDLKNVTIIEKYEYEERRYE